MRIAVTGGAGYIGAHVVWMLRRRGDETIVIDDLSTGIKSRIADAQLETVDLARVEPGILAATLQGCDAVIHLAAKKRVDESLRRPALYYLQNVGGLARVLEAVELAQVSTFVFSSSAAVYGETPLSAVDEDEPARPVNPYGATKLTGEQLVESTAAATGLRAASLRYFNVAGAASTALGDREATNLIPIAIMNAFSNKSTEIFGTDYPTLDGTCVRDFVHVTDLARAHLATLDALIESRITTHRVYNVGTGTGYSVQEVVNAVGRAIPGCPAPVVSPRRAGDPASVIADPSRIQTELGWRAEFDLEAIVESSVEALSPR